MADVTILIVRDPGTSSLRPKDGPITKVKNGQTVVFDHAVPGATDLQIHFKGATFPFTEPPQASFNVTGGQQFKVTHNPPAGTTVRIEYVCSMVLGGNIIGLSPGTVYGGEMEIERFP